MLSLDIKNKSDIILKFGANCKDSGSSEVQIALLTFRITKLQEHFFKHKKDYHSRRGLLHMVSRRRKLLIYLKNTNMSRYINLINILSLRH